MWLKDQKRVIARNVIKTIAFEANSRDSVLFSEKRFTELVSGWRFQQTARNFGHI